MIAHLKGKVINMYKQKLVLDVNGVGYLVGVVGDDFTYDQEISLYIHTAVRENEISLWGFKTIQELQLFEMLLSVSGVGLKTSQSILATLGINQVVQAIIHEDAKMLRLPGVGVKTSERIILDMRGKLNMSEYAGESSEMNAMSESREVVDDATVALESLGYRRVEIEAALKRLKLSDYANTSELVKAILVNI